MALLIVRNFSLKSQIKKKSLCTYIFFTPTAKCSLLLERALKVQLESSSKLKTNVHAVEAIENSTEVASKPEFDNSILELNQESSSVLTDIKENIDRLRNLETAQKILLNNQKQVRIVQLLKSQGNFNFSTLT